MFQKALKQHKFDYQIQVKAEDQIEKLALKSKALANEYEEIDPEDVAIVEGKVYSNVSTIGYDFFQEALQ